MTDPFSAGGADAQGGVAEETGGGTCVDGAPAGVCSTVEHRSTTTVAGDVDATWVVFPRTGVHIGRAWRVCSSWG